MRILLIDLCGAALDWAQQCLEVGHEVRMWCGPRKDGTRCDVGDGIVQRVPRWEPHMDWADLIFLTDNAKEIEKLEPYRKKGYPIFGPGVEAAKLELDRDAGQQAFKKAGIDIMESIEFNDYDKAIEYVKKNMKRYVSKPSGDADKALSYVSKSPADMIFMLQRWKEMGKNKAPFILQEFNPGIEMAVGGWFGPAGWSKWFCENFEHKKLMAGDNGVNTGEMGCYSADTEVLTETGWKYWPEVSKADKLATLTADDKVVFEYPSEVVSYDVDTEMVAWSNQTIDILVTPNHNMYVQRQAAARKGLNLYEFIKAEDCTQVQYEVKRTAIWDGEVNKNFILPEYTHRKGLGQVTKPSVSIPVVDFARFMGLYIAEGSSAKSQVSIAQSHPKKADLAEKIVKSIGFKYSRSGHGFTISNSQLASYTKPLGRAWEKRVPEFVKFGTPEVISAFLEGYALGDGHTFSSGYRCFYSCNRELLGDVQELLLKSGSLGVLSQRPERTKFSRIDGREIRPKRPQYELIERPNKLRSWLDSRDKYTVPYKGKVYCATVSSHVLFVRRNGKPVWCGNTCLTYVEHSKLADEMLLPLTGMLKKMNYVGYVDVAVIIDKDGKPWPLEFTTRPGWPCFIIQTALHLGDPAQWMLDLINGQDTLEVLEGEVSTGVVMAIPDFPYGNKKKEEVSGFPIYGVEGFLHTDIHLCEVKMGTAPIEKDGKIVDGRMFVTAGDYVLVATGTDYSVAGSSKRAYRALKKAEVPNSPMWRIDIGKRLEKHLEEIQEFGYADSWSWE